jgi:3-methyl-2-oxobutanoate hydroxymethyltransferase
MGTENAPSAGWPQDRRITVRDLQRATDRRERWAMITSYDAMTAGLFDGCGVRAILVGDTAGMVVFGHTTTVPVTQSVMMPLVQAVVRGTRRALVVADMPFGSYQEGPLQALRTGIAYLQEGGAQAVKLEGGRRYAEHVRALVDAGVPVMGHLGLTPQSVNVLGGMNRVMGKGEAAPVLIDDALALEEAGAFALVLEAVPASVGAAVADKLRIPVIGIGAGPDVDAQILLWQDLAGLTPGHQPRFVKRYIDLRALLGGAVRRFVDEVGSGSYPAPEHTYPG